MAESLGGESSAASLHEACRQCLCDDAKLSNLQENGGKDDSLIYFRFRIHQGAAEGAVEPPTTPKSSSPLFCE